MSGAENRIIAHQHGRIYFPVTELGSVQVEHEIAQGALQSGKVVAQYNKTRTRQSRRRLKIHLPQRFADFEMLRRRIDTPNLSDLAYFLIVVFIHTFRYIRQRNIGQNRKRLFKLGLQLALFGFGLLKS